MKDNRYNYYNQSGMYRHKVLIQVPVIIVDEYKQQVETFEDFGSYFAMKKTQKSNEIISAGQENVEIVDRFVIKYSKLLHEMIEAEGTGFKLFHRDTEYEVISAINDDELNVTITIVGKVVTK